MVDANTVLLSREDVKVDRSGVNVRLHEGMLISVCMDDLDEHGKIDDLVANGVVVRNVNPGWGAHVKWSCQIDEDGIRTQSEVMKD